MNNREEMEKIINTISDLNMDEDLKLVLLQTVYNFYIRDDIKEEIRRIRRKMV